MQFIERNIYLQQIEPFIGKNLIKVITGQRRTGKSCLLKQIMNKIEQKKTNVQIIYINKEDFEFDNLRTYADLIRYVEQEKKADEVAVFIDEIQEIAEFEKALRHLFTKEIYDLYCTGSNAKMLSGDLATILSGRSIEVEVFSLSYSEFLQFHKLNDSTESFDKYMIVGGMPNLIQLPLDEEVIFSYLKNLYNTIIVRDVLERHQIRNALFLRNLCKYIADNTGSLVSGKRISDFLKSQQISMSAGMILEYLDFLCEAFFLYKVNRSNLQGKKIFEIGEKYYFSDIGLRNSLIGYKAMDINKILENVVFMHLKIAGFQITIGQDRQKEIDFVAQKNSELIYIQVCYRLDQQSTIDREFGNLKKINNHYPKWVVSMDNSSLVSTEGIRHLHVRQFCNEIVVNNR